MEIQEFIEKFADALDIMDTSNIEANTALSDLDGWSSLALVQVVVFFDEEFGKEVSIEDLKKCNTINDLYQQR